MPRKTPPKLSEATKAVFRAYGRQGGAKGGTARAAKLTAAERSAAARHAALVRWRRKRD